MLTKVTSALTRPEAATLALALLGGADNAVHTEDVAVQLETLAPEMFSWQKYRDRTDKELVRVALSDARLKARLVIGSHARGWMLTPSGVKFAQANRHRVEHDMQQRQSPDDAHLRRERARLLETEAYVRAQAGEVDLISADEADAFFRLNVYVRTDSREKKIARIENQFGNDPEIGPVVTVLALRARERE